MLVRGTTQRWQIDVVAGMDFRQIGRAERMVAVRAGGKRRHNDPVGVFGQSAGDTRMAVARLLRMVGEFGF